MFLFYYCYTLLQLLVVVALSLYIRLVQNWMLGEIGCYLVPVIQVGNTIPASICVIREPGKSYEGF